MYIHYRNLAACTFVSLLALSACKKKKGSSSSEAPTSEVPAASGDRPKSVDDAKVTAATTALKLPGALNLIASEGGTSLRLSDFNDEQGRFNTDDRSMRALQTVQMIMCFMAKTGYADEHVVNAGTYIAQVDMSLCDKEKSSGGGGGGQSQVKKVQMTQVTVDSTREENKPLKAKMWFDMQEGGQDGGDTKNRIAISLTVAEGPNSSNPVGIFRLVFVQGMVDGAGTYTPSGHGQLESKRDENNALVVSFAEVSDQKTGDNSRTGNTLVAVRLATEDEKVVGGWATLKDEQSERRDGQVHAENSDFRLAFDRKYFSALNNVTGEAVCRDQNDFNMSVWQYGVYNDAGARVKMNGGFGFLFEKANGSKGHGWASYYGIWADGSDLPEGTVVTKENYGDNSAPTVQYTVKKGKGKLTKYTRHTMTLNELDGIDMQYWGQNGASQRVAYSKSKGKFVVTGTGSQSQNGPMEYTDVNPPTDFEIPQWGASFYAEALGGQVELILDSNSTPTGAAFFSQEDVTGTQSNITLHCLQSCVKANLTSDMLRNSSFTVSSGDVNNPWMPFNYQNAPAYTFDKARLVLKNGDGDIVLLNGQTVPDGAWAPSMSGLVDDQTFAAMQAQNVPGHQAHSQQVTYSWSVGDPKNSWSTYQALVDASGKPVAFDAPIIIDYTHKAENDATGAATSKTFDKKFHLQFDGTNLQIPGHQDKETGYWIQDFAIKAGVKSDDEKFIFKPLEGTKYMKSVDSAKCADLDTGKTPDLPGSDFYDESKANTEEPPAAGGLSTRIVNGVYVES